MQPEPATLPEVLRDRHPDAVWEHRGDRLWRARQDFGMWLYALAEPDGAYVAVAAGIDDYHPDEHRGIEAEFRRHLSRRIEHERLPVCVVPDCGEKAPVEFLAAEPGRLAGRDWQPGDPIRLCPEHAEDVYYAQGAYGREQLAEWLQPDAKLDTLDAFDAGHDLIHGREIVEQRARALLVSQKPADPG